MPISRTRSFRLRLQLLGHIGHEHRRRDGLTFADRQRHVEIGPVDHLRGTNSCRGVVRIELDHARVLDARADQFLVDHAIAGLFERLGGARLWAGAVAGQAARTQSAAGHQ